MLVLAVKWNGDELSQINVVGLLVCLIGIISHVVHKVRIIQALSVPRLYEYEDDKLELNKSLITNPSGTTMYLSSDSDDEHSDTQELFNILNRHDR